MEIQINEILNDGCFSCRNCGEDVLLGTHFSSFVHYKYTESAEDRLIICKYEVKNLRLVKVVFASKEVEALPSGHTAVIGLESTDLSKLIDVCKSLKKHEYIGLF